MIEGKSTMIDIVTILCLAVLILETLIVAVNILIKKPSERTAFLRSFKKGKCAVIYITAVPLYWIGHIDAGQKGVEAFFAAINKIINLVVLKYDTTSISGLMGENPLYRRTIYFCFVLVGLNALLFTFSLIGQHIWCRFQTARIWLSHKNKLFLFGNNSENQWLYQSDKKRSRVIVDALSSKDEEALYAQRIAFISSQDTVRFLTKLLKRVSKMKKREYVLVINTQADEQNMRLCRAVVECLNRTAPEKRKNLFLRLNIFVFGDPRYETIYADIVSEAYGCIHYVNKYQKVAMDFIDRYPLTKFMDERQIDFETSLIRPDVNINVLMIGFGKTNQQIFMTSVANNQFLTAGEDEPVLKQVEYFIFDKQVSEHNKNLNHSYYRFQNECRSIDQSAYLPLPQQPARETYVHLDINDAAFYKRIKEIVQRNPNDANYIVIAFASDLENLDMAQKLVEKRREWNAEELTIFVKMRNWRQEQTLLREPRCYFIANERDIVFDVETLIGNTILSMSQERNQIYDLEYAITHGEKLEVSEEYVRKNRAAARENWYKEKRQMERESSLYCCLSLRSKLHLMGLDYCPKERAENALSQEEYWRWYAGDDIPVTYEGILADEKPIVKYTLDFAPSRRRTMAIHEHQRWNSFMISKGTVPATIDQIKNEMVMKGGTLRHSNGRNYEVRRHGNLTTFDGLVTFRKILAERSNENEATYDVIKYDYQLLDDAYWLLDRHGMAIVRSGKCADPEWMKQ